MLRKRECNYIIQANRRLEISGGRSKVKKFGLTIVAVTLTSLLLSCGGGTKKTSSPTQNPRDSIETSIAAQRPVATATKDTGEKTINVSGKTCPPAGTYKVTSADLVEAVVNTYCRSISDNSSGYPKGTVEFVSLKVRPNTVANSVVTTIDVRFFGCADCPHVYSGMGSCDKNPLKEWQCTKSSGNNLTFEETEASKAAKEQRDKQRSIDQASSVVIDIPVRDITTDIWGYFEADLVVSGKVNTVELLCQLDDGRVVDYFSDRPLTLPTVKFLPNDIIIRSAGGQFHLKILAYKFQVAPGYVSPDWVYFK